MKSHSGSGTESIEPSFLGSHVALRVLVADREATARHHLIGLLDAHPEVSVIAQAKDGREVLNIIESLALDVVFLDVQSPDLDAFGVLQRRTNRPLVVFTSAHDDYALAAFRENAVDYLIKPIAQEDLGRAIKRLIARSTATALSAPLSAPPSSRSARVIAQLLQQIKTTISSPPQLLLSIRDTLRPVRFDQIVLLEARDKTTFVHTVEQHYECCVSLTEFQSKLPPGDFLRIHRRHIVNRLFIGALRRWGNRQFRVELTVPFPEEVFVSRRFCDDVLLRLGTLA